MSGRLSRNKGARTERAIVRLLQDQGIAAEKISGMYKPGADLSVPVLGVDRAAEVKRRADGCLAPSCTAGASVPVEVSLPLFADRARMLYLATAPGFD